MVLITLSFFLNRGKKVGDVPMIILVHLSQIVQVM